MVQGLGFCSEWCNGRYWASESHSKNPPQRTSSLRAQGSVVFQRAQGSVRYGSKALYETPKEGPLVRAFAANMASVTLPDYRCCTSPKKTQRCQVLSITESHEDEGSLPK